MVEKVGFLLKKGHEYVVLAMISGKTADCRKDFWRKSYSLVQWKWGESIQLMSSWFWHLLLGVCTFCSYGRRGETQTIGIVCRLTPACLKMAPLQVYFSKGRDNGLEKTIPHNGEAKNEAMAKHFSQMNKMRPHQDKSIQLTKYDAKPKNATNKKKSTQ